MSPGDTAPPLLRPAEVQNRLGSGIIRASIGGAVGVLLVVWLLCAIVGMTIGSSKGRTGDGFALGLLFGPLGVLIVAVLSPTPKAQALRDFEVAIATEALETRDMEEVDEDEAPSSRSCPWCAEEIKPAARLCRYCGRDVEPINADSSEAPDRPNASPVSEDARAFDIEPRSETSADSSKVRPSASPASHAARAPVIQAARAFAAELREIDIDSQMGGYDRHEVNAFFEDAAKVIELGGSVDPSPGLTFRKTFRGYDVRVVRELIDRIRTFKALPTD